MNINSPFGVCPRCNKICENDTGGNPNCPCVPIKETVPELNLATCEKCSKRFNVAYRECPVCHPTEEAPKAPDMVNHPPHYTSHPSGVECIQVTEHMSFCVGNAVKYLWRADEKGSAIEDLEKARWYITREIERRKGMKK